jgi:hypothetical protein
MKRIILEPAGELVTNEQLVTKVGLITFAKKNRLMTYLAALLCTLFDDRARNRYIASVTTPRHCFAVSRLRVETKLAFVAYAAAVAGESTHNLPILSAQMIGRFKILTLFSTCLLQWRFIKLATTAELQKTTEALRKSGTGSAARWRRPEEFR